jgi:hypothetical protein
MIALEGDMIIVKLLAVIVDAWESGWFGEMIGYKAAENQLYLYLSTPDNDTLPMALYAQQTFGASTASKIDRSTRHPAAQNSAWDPELHHSSASFAIAASSNTHALALEHTCAILKLPQTGSQRSAPRPRLTKLESPKQCRQQHA